MTPAQAEAREERVAIMTLDGGVGEEEAHAYCDSKPWLYGLRGENPVQPDLMNADSRHQTSPPRANRMQAR